MRAVPRSGGGFHAIGYALSLAFRVGPLRLLRAMWSKNACKTCALGMGGARGGMRDELGGFPEVCKKSLQAMAGDLQSAVPARFFKTLGVKSLQSLSSRELETAGRLTEPLILRQGARHYEPVSWESALSLVASTLTRVPPESVFFYVSGRSSTEAGFLLSLFARAYGTNHVHNCSYYCHQASGVGLGESLGTGTATVNLEDVEKADFFVLVGGNPASNHPRLMNHLRRLRSRGGHVVVVNPVREPGLVRFRVPSHVGSLFLGSDIASHYAQIAIGGDIAWCLGVAKALFASGGVDRSFLDRACVDGDAVEAMALATRWDVIETAAGVDRSEIETVAAMYAKAERAIFAWTMGVTHHLHGVANVQWLVNLALLRGMVGRMGAGVLPIRGHSNVQAMGTVGVTPALKDAILAQFEALGYRAPKTPGLDTMACMEAAHRGDMKVGIALGGNLFGSNPDPAFATAAFSRLDLMVYLNTALNTGHAHGLARDTLILPVLARDEEPYQTTQESMFNYVRLSAGGKARHGGPRGEVPILAQLAAAVLGDRGPIDWGALVNPGGIRKLIARMVPNLSKIAAIDTDGGEFEIPGRVLHLPHFPTKSGRARLFAHAIPAHAIPKMSLGAHQLLLMTVRSEGQFNTVVYEDVDHYRGQERRDVILLSPADMSRLGIAADALVEVQSAIGQLCVRARPFDIHAGGALMYYPEANVLVPRDVDEKSRTPAFKSVPISVKLV